ncbi:hypothetical protein ACWDCC_13525 [Streptomyces sp. NPDC001102]
MSGELLSTALRGRAARPSLCSGPACRITSSALRLARSDDEVAGLLQEDADLISIT